MSMTPPSLPPQAQTTQPAVSNSQLALVVYILYFTSYVIGITALVGVVIAHVQIGSTTDPMLRSHYQWQIRTFWIGILYFVIGVALCIVLIGILRLVVLVHLDTGAHRQGRARAQRKPADRQSDVVAVWIGTCRRARPSALAQPLAPAISFFM